MNLSPIPMSAKPVRIHARNVLSRLQERRFCRQLPFSVIALTRPTHCEPAVSRAASGPTSTQPMPRACPLQASAHTRVPKNGFPPSPGVSSLRVQA